MYSNFLRLLFIVTLKLSDLAKSFGTELKGSIDFNKIDHSTNLSLLKDEIISYNKQDCLVLYQVISKFAD